MPDTNSLYSFDAIGIIRSPFSQKFGIPRQPRLTPAIKSSIVLNPKFNADIVDGLKHSSHLWIIFVFSQCYQQSWKPKVRPPRLGGNQKMGVLATRSPFRPNPIGISAVKIENICIEQTGVTIEVSGADLLDGTPILDIKPYIPYSDMIEDARHTLAESFTALSQPIFFSSQALKSCEQHLAHTGEKLSVLIEQVLRCDPRPAYHKSAEREYGMILHHWNIRWSISEQRIDILAISRQIPTSEK